MKHYYAIACDLESATDDDGLLELANEWWAQGFQYRVFGALHRAVTRYLV